jgi:hypothetical protein
MKRYVVSIILIVIFGVCQSHATDFRTFVNPGLKLGYRMTFRSGSSNLHEVGTYIKGPIRVSGPSYNFGGN